MRLIALEVMSSLGLRVSHAYLVVSSETGGVIRAFQALSSYSAQFFESKEVMNDALSEVQTASWTEDIFVLF